MDAKNKFSRSTGQGNDSLNVTDAEQSLGALLRLPYQLLAKQVYGHLARTGYADIRPAHGAVFRHIVPGGSRATDLADQAQMTKQSMSYLIEYLRERGYVEFRNDPNDGRAKLVYLTERGMAVQRAALEQSCQFERHLASLLGEDEMRQLRRLLKCLHDHLAPIP